MVRRALAGAAVVLGALCAGPAAAVAHPLLVQTAPAAGLIAPQAPDAIRLQLSEPVVARGSRLTVTGPRGVKVATGSVVRSSDGKGLSVKPKTPLRSAVYRVRWTALGDDGHLVRGDFSFGIAGAKGAPPPGAERLGGTSASGLGGERTDQDGFVGTLARWLGIAAASFLFGAAALLAVLRRRDDATGEAAADALRPLAPLAWLLAAVAVSETVIARIVSTADGSVDVGLLTTGATGRAELVRALVIVGGSAALGVVGLRASRAADPDDDAPLPAPIRLYGVLGVLLLLTYAFSGHALAGVGAFGLVAQGVHVVAAGLWLGGLLALVAATRAEAVRPLAGARAFAPLAAGGLGLAIVTGVIAAVREVDRWSLLRWSDYGRVVIVKSVLVALVALAGAFAAWRSRRVDSPGPRRSALRAEAVGVLAVVALASVLAGLAQGRGRPLPAQEGALAPGPAFASALLGSGSGKVTLTPARTGLNRFVTTLGAGARPDVVGVRLACACAPGRDVRGTLKRTVGSTYAGDLRLPAEGQWFAYLSAGGDTTAAPVSLQVGLPRTAGSTPAPLLAVADLSGPNAVRCRSHVLGLQLAVARINAEGGVDGGRKLQPLVLDDGGDASRAAALTTEAIEHAGRPVALAGACGDGSTAATDAASRAGVPVIAGDPATETTTDPGVFRIAADQYAQGWGLVQYLALRVVPIGAPGVRRVEVIAAGDAAGRRFVAGARTLAAKVGLTIDVLPPGSLATRSVPELKKLLDRERVVSLLLDEPRSGGADAEALVRLGRSRYDFPPAPIMLSSRVASEELVVRAGTLGRIGVLSAASEVSPGTRDALAYSRTIRTLYPGEAPSLDGIRGYVAGLALRAAVGGGRSLSEGAIAKVLTSPPVFTDALLTPWSPRTPGLGTRAVIALTPNFLASGITPVAQGGQRFDGTYFPDGAWTNASVTAYGPGAPTPNQDPSAPVPPQTTP